MHSIFAQSKTHNFIIFHFTFFLIYDLTFFFLVCRNKFALCCHSKGLVVHQSVKNMRIVPQAEDLLTKRHHVRLLKIALYGTTGYDTALITGVALIKDL